MGDKGMRELLMMEPIFKEAISVSYTHLDVYKRQLVKSN